MVTGRNQADLRSRRDIRSWARPVRLSVNPAGISAAGRDGPVAACDMNPETERPDG